ncbi:unnamed protein product [Discosporangium mesarthrocarpum]
MFVIGAASQCNALCEALNTVFSSQESGEAIAFAGAAVAWFSRTQQVVTLSSTDADYVALGECEKELLFLSNVLDFLKSLSGVWDMLMVLFKEKMRP